MVETPVLFETFVRVEYARQVWDAIKAAQPKTLYFYSNKGRAEKKGEIEWNDEIRSWINEINWECDLHTWFRDESVDVYTSLRGAISWLFDNEEMGIILEDDCVPTMAFFNFCDQMLKKFKGDQRVWCVSGDNFFDYQYDHYDYHFSQYHYMYGWASWRNRWQAIDWNVLPIHEICKCHLFDTLYKTKEQVVAREKEIRNFEKFLCETKCWDYYFGLYIDINRGLTIHPCRHLVTNIGVVGVNHKEGGISIINKAASYVGQSFVVKSEPAIITADIEFDRLLFDNFQRKGSLWFRLQRRFYWWRGHICDIK